MTLNQLTANIATNLRFYRRSRLLEIGRPEWLDSPAELESISPADFLGPGNRQSISIGSA